ncbi:hypothetical protein KM043_011634 [Ampulex compressa]|nr:hypothetical protein KM043_011634 [Ampulex compressa]
MDSGSIVLAGETGRGGAEARASGVAWVERLRCLLNAEGNGGGRKEPSFEKFSSGWPWRRAEKKGRELTTSSGQAEEAASHVIRGLLQALLDPDNEPVHTLPLMSLLTYFYFEKNVLEAQSLLKSAARLRDPDNKSS